MDADNMIFVNPGPDDGFVVVTEPAKGTWTAAKIQREVNKFYGQTGWRIVESTWVGPAHPNGWDGDYKGDLNDDEILECNALDDDAVPAWLLVHTDFKTILWGTEYVPNPHYRAKIVSRRLHREFLREMNPNTAHRDAEPEVTDEQTGNARKQRR